MSVVVPLPRLTTDLEEEVEEEEVEEEEDAVGGWPIETCVRKRKETVHHSFIHLPNKV